jgi:type VI secretion system secreted protein Hcp
MATDFLLEIDGIKGESQDGKHKDKIEIQSFSFGATNSGSMAQGSGGGSGKASFQDMHFTSTMCKASPDLFISCAQGKHIAKATLICRKAGTKQQEYLTIKLVDILVSSYQTGAAGASGEFPTDQFSLNFTKIEFTYCPQKKDGSLDTGITRGYNIKEQK